MSKQIILADISPDHSAERLMSRVIRLASNATTQVHLYICDYHSSLASSFLLHPDSLQKTIEHRRKEHEQYLQQLSEQYAHSNIEYRIQVDWHKPSYEAVLKAAESVKATLILKEAHQHNLLNRLLFTPSDYQLLKSSPTPLMLIKNKPWQDNGCVMAAVDPTHQLSQESQLDDALVEHAKALSAQLNLPLKLVHVFDPTGWEVVMNSSASAGVMGQFVVLDTPEEHQQLLNQIRDAHKNQLNELREKHQLDENSILFLEGFPEEQLEHACEKYNAAVTLVGTTYRSGFLGSTAEKLLDHIGSDLLAIKPKDFAALETH